MDKSSFPSALAYCQETCLQKARCVGERFRTSEAKLIVSADTIVVGPEDIIYEKPADKADMVRMLNLFRGQTIKVITTVTILHRQATDEPFAEHSFDETSLMHMANYDDQMINDYLATGQGLDHSGALAYQGSALLLVNSIEGCFYNLIGFPAARFFQELKTLLKL